MDTKADVWLKGENSMSKYYGYGDTTVTVLDTHGKLWCMTDHEYDCKHVRAVKTHLQGEPPVLGE